MTMIDKHLEEFWFCWKEIFGLNGGFNENDWEAFGGIKIVENKNLD
jgi:hypothetical protein